MLCLQERSCFIIGIAQAESIICNDMDIQHKDISVARHWLWRGYSSFGLILHVNRATTNMIYKENSFL